MQSLKPRKTRNKSINMHAFEMHGTKFVKQVTPCRSIWKFLAPVADDGQVHAPDFVASHQRSGPAAARIGTPSHLLETTTSRARASSVPVKGPVATPRDDSKVTSPKHLCMWKTCEVVFWSLSSGRDSVMSYGVGTLKLRVEETLPYCRTPERSARGDPCPGRLPPLPFGSGAVHAGPPGVAHHA